MSTGKQFMKKGGKPVLSARKWSRTSESTQNTVVNIKRKPVLNAKETFLLVTSRDTSEFVVTLPLMSVPLVRKCLDTRRI